MFCNKLSVATLLDLGLQPISNRYLPHSGINEFRHPLILGHCSSCDLAQLVNPLPARELLPPYDWISYNEPEGHLDELVSMLVRLPGVNQASSIGAISFKDDSTLRRLELRGCQRTWRLDQRTDLGITQPGAGVETVQERLSPSVAETVMHTHGKADVLIVRHILEHAHDINAFASSLKTLVSSNGYLVFEVPDCSRAFLNHDFTTLWEEHPVYFTPDSFRRFLELSGFTIVNFMCYPYAFENSLVAIVRVNGPPDCKTIPSKNVMMNRYAAAFPVVRKRLRRFLDDFNNGQGKVALFGAGHLACTYVNLFDIGRYVQFIADDSPHKQGLLMPGSRLPIVGAQALLEQDIKLCLLSLSPEAEDKVVDNNLIFTERGGIFASIFPDSRRALRLP